MLSLSAQIEPLFAGWDETMLWSYFQGFHGTADAFPDEKPDSARICVGDFCFFAGTPREELLRFPGDTVPSLILVPRSPSWSNLIQKTYGDMAVPSTRYAFFKDASGFDRERLARFAQALPDGFRYQEIGKEEYLLAKQTDWMGDFCSQFPDYAAYARSGIGFLVFHGDEPVCGASSYTAYRDGIEIEIDTKEPYRRNGLARACAARLMLACLERGLYPSWDAANPVSAHLAETLGYRFDCTYPVFDLNFAPQPLAMQNEESCG